MLHVQIERPKEVDSRLLVVGSQCRAPKFLVDPLEGLSMWQCGRSWNLGHDPDFQH
jgi:hypothetical protein